LGVKYWVLAPAIEEVKQKQHTLTQTRS